MGIRRWLRSKSSSNSDLDQATTSAEQNETEIQADIAVAYADERKASIEAAALELTTSVEPSEQEDVEQTPRPEYDAGEVTVDELLVEDDVAEVVLDHGALNVVEYENLDDVEDVLADAKIIGDIPKPVEFDEN